jgi:malate dehydrogenase
MHIAQIGTGRVGRPTAYTIMNEKIADTLTVCDTKPGLAQAFAEELKHVTASTGQNIEINSCDQDDQVTNADIILISAGEPRQPGVKMTRRDLAAQNAKIIKQISQVAKTQNPQAKYIVISNPVDAMAMICKKYTQADFVISTGTNLESLRFRSKIAAVTNTPINKIQGWVGGEHGDAATPLWSTTKINNLPAEQYAQNKNLPKTEIETYVKSVSKSIVDNIGGTEYGPAASFRDITRAIIKNTNEILSIATPIKLEAIPQSTFVGIPTHLGKKIGPTILNQLSDQEKQKIAEAAKAIYQTYQITIDQLEP